MTQHTCMVCKTQHSNKGLNRHSKVCPICYEKYRLAYNLIESSRYRAKQNNLEHTLTMEWILNKLTTNKCPKTNLEFTYTQNGKNYLTRKPTTPSIDKIDATKGYTPENCQIVCWWYNVSKQRFTDEEVLKLCQAVVTTYDMNNALPVQK